MHKKTNELKIVSIDKYIFLYTIDQYIQTQTNREKGLHTDIQIETDVQIDITYNAVRVEIKVRSLLKKKIKQPTYFTSNTNLNKK